MDDVVKDTAEQPVLEQIEKLVAEEHKLYQHGGVAEEDSER